MTNSFCQSTTIIYHLLPPLTHFGHVIYKNSGAIQEQLSPLTNNKVIPYNLISYRKTSRITTRIPTLVPHATVVNRVSLRNYRLTFMSDEEIKGGTVWSESRQICFSTIVWVRVSTCVLCLVTFTFNYPHILHWLIFNFCNLDKISVVFCFSVFSHSISAKS